MSTRTKPVAYWITTVLVAFAMFSGGIGELTRQPGNLEVVTILGYPTYFLTIIGLWKVAGAIALLVPRFPLLKEWAYAGIFFNMTGAAASHLAVGDYGIGAFHLIVTISLAGLTVLSWALRPASRRLVPVTNGHAAVDRVAAAPRPSFPSAG